MSSGIYWIHNRISGIVYVGQASHFVSRFWHHRRSLRRGTHHCKHLQRSWNKYGEDAFEFAIIEEVPCCKDDLKSCEQFWIDYLKFIGCSLFNTALVAGSSLGIKRSAATRAKMSAAKKGQKRSAEALASVAASRTPETMAKIVATRRGYSHTAETRAKLSAALKGKPKSKEQVAKRLATYKINKQTNKQKHPI